MSELLCLHRWTVASRHPTSEGTVIYLRCHCGEHWVTRDAQLPDVLAITGTITATVTAV